MLGRIEDRTLRSDGDQRRSGALDGEREAVGIAQAGTGDKLRDAVVAELVVGGDGALDIGLRDGRSRAVRQGKPDGALERQGFGGRDLCVYK